MKIRSGLNLVAIMFYAEEDIEGMVTTSLIPLGSARLLFEKEDIRNPTDLMDSEFHVRQHDRGICCDVAHHCLI